MPSSAPASLLDTAPLELAARAVLAGALAIWLVLRAGPLLLELLIPYFESTVHWLDTRYKIEFELTYRTGHGVPGSELALLGRAAVTRLFFIPVDGGIIPMHAGNVLTSSTATGVLLQPAVMVIALLTGWPARSRREMTLRAPVGMAVLAFWMLAGLPLTLWLYFHNIPLQAFAPQESMLAAPLGKFLLNGGSVVLGAGMGVAAVIASARLSVARRTRQNPDRLPGAER